MYLTPNEANDLRTRYLALLEQELPEQRYQEFLEQNTSLIPREFIQNHGLHFYMVIRKLGFGQDYISDFFYFSKSSDDWNAVFVEIESPGKKFFRQSTNEFSRDFNQALQQINSWRAWLNTPANAQAFLQNDARLLFKPPHMARNPVHFKYVLVLGRRDEYAANDLRRGLIHAQEQDDFKILSFDSLAENLASKIPVHIAARRNQYLDILSDKLEDPSFMSWIDLSEVRVSQAFRDDLEATKKEWAWHRAGADSSRSIVEWALERVIVK